jgi:hypothetical protein
MGLSLLTMGLHHIWRYVASDRPLFDIPPFFITIAKLNTGLICLLIGPVFTKRNVLLHSGSVLISCLLILIHLFIGLGRYHIPFFQYAPENVIFIVLFVTMAKTTFNKSDDLVLAFNDLIARPRQNSILALLGILSIAFALFANYSVFNIFR